MDYSVSNIGLCIWVGEDRFVTHKVDIQDQEIAATFNDIRGHMSYTVPVNTFALEFTRAYKVYTSYRPVCDRQGRPAFLAVTLFVPYDITVHNLTALLESISLKYYKNHYGLGGIMKQGEQVIPELYIREVDSATLSKDPDGTWTGRASKQISKPKILPFTEVGVVESFFEHPHRPSFHNCQEVLFVPNAYLGNVDSGISLPRSAPEDFYAVDGIDAGQEAKGFLIERDNKLPYSVKEFAYNGVSQSYWSPYLRHGSTVSFTLSKSRYSIDITFEGTLAQAIGSGYILETAEGYKFAPALSFRPRQKTLTFQFPSLYGTNAMFVMVAVSGEHRRQSSIMGDRAQFPFAGEELGYRWTFIVEEKNYEFTVFTGVPDDDTDDNVTVDNCRLFEIVDHTSKNITLDFGPAVAFNLKRNAKPENLSGKWLLPSNLNEACFKLELSNFFEKNVTGIADGHVEISLDRIGYQLCVPRTFWNAMSPEQKRTASFRLDGNVWTFANSNKASNIIVVSETKDAARGSFSTKLNGEQVQFQFGFRVNEQEDLFMIIPAIVELSIARGCSVKLGNNAVLQEGSVILPQGLVDERTFESQGYVVQRVGREDNEGGSFPGYCISSPGSRNASDPGSVLGKNQNQTSGGQKQKLTYGRHDVQYFVNGEARKCSKLSMVGDYIPTAEGLELAIPFDVKATRRRRKNRGYDVVERRGDRGEPCYYFTSKQRGGGNRGGSGLPLWIWIAIIAAVLTLGGVGTYFLVEHVREGKKQDPEQSTDTTKTNVNVDKEINGLSEEDKKKEEERKAEEYNRNLSSIQALVLKLYSLDCTKDDVASLKQITDLLTDEQKGDFVSQIVGTNGKLLEEYSDWSIDEFIHFHEVMFSGSLETFKDASFLKSKTNDLDLKWAKYAHDKLWGTGATSDKKMGLRYFYYSGNWNNNQSAFDKIAKQMNDESPTYQDILTAVSKILYVPATRFDGPPSGKNPSIGEIH